MMDESKHDEGPAVSRRSWLRASLATASSPLWASLATGLPLAWILGQREVLGAPDGDAQFLLLNLSGAGDPINAGAPGVYGVEGVQLNQHPSMAPKQTTFGDQTVTAAAPWASLPDWVRQRTAFIHHRTYTNSHPNFFKVLGLFGGAKREQGSGQEQLPSLYGSELASALQSVQREPVILSNIGSRVTFEGREQPVVQPSALAPMLAGASNEGAKNLELLREKQLDTIYQELSLSGTPAQKEFLDRYASTRAQLTQVRERVAGLLSEDTEWTNDAAGQIQAAQTLLQLRIAPVVVVRIPFGGDNHADSGLVREAEETNSGVALIGSLMQSLEGAGLKDQVTFASFNVFGRTLAPVREGNGRNHNQNHHTTVVIGPKVRGGVAGGIEPLGKDFAASALDSVTGQVSSGGSTHIPAEQTLEATSTTLGRALGLSADMLSQRITDGRSIDALLR